jgi:hypothetical protein
MNIFSDYTITIFVSVGTSELAYRIMMNEAQMLYPIKTGKTFVAD